MENSIILVVLAFLLLCVRPASADGVITVPTAVRCGGESGGGVMNWVYSGQWHPVPGIFDTKQAACDAAAAHAFSFFGEAGMHIGNMAIGTYNSCSFALLNVNNNVWAAISVSWGVVAAACSQYDATGTPPSCTCNAGFAPNETATDCVPACAIDAGTSMDFSSFGSMPETLEYEGCTFFKEGGLCGFIIMPDGVQSQTCEYISTGASATDNPDVATSSEGWGAGTCAQGCIAAANAAGATAAATAAAAAANSSTGPLLVTVQGSFSAAAAAAAADAAALPNATPESVRAAATAAAHGVELSPEVLAIINSVSDSASTAAAAAATSAATAAALAAGASSAAAATAASLASTAAVVAAANTAAAAASAAASAAAAAAASSASAAQIAEAGFLSTEATLSGILGQFSGDGFFSSSGVSVSDTGVVGTAGVAGGVASGVEAAVGLLDGVAGGFDSDREGIAWWNWEPPLSVGTCQPFARGVMGRTVTIDICQYVVMLRDLLGWLFAIFTLWHVYGVVVKGRS